MKIVVVCEGYPSPGNQVYVFVQQLVDTLVDQGADINVIAPQSLTNCVVWRKPVLPFKNRAFTSKGNSYTVYRPKYVSFGNSKGVLGRIAEFLKRSSILQTLKHVKHDVVYAHFWEFACHTADYCSKNQIPLFVACGEGDNALEMMVETKPADFIAKLKRTVTGVISVSSENKRKCILYGLSDEDNITVLPNCVNTELFHPKDVTALREKLGIEDDDYVVSFVGGFIERKGSARLADAITKLNDKSIKSIFIGKTLSADAAVPECEGIIHRGPLEHELIPDYLNCSDVFVLPTQKEGCSNAIVEALSCGLPVVSSTGSFNDDILTPENSIRIDPNNVNEIAEAIKAMRERRWLRQTLSETIKANNPYSIDVRASKIFTFIRTNCKE